MIILLFHSLFMVIFIFSLQRMNFKRFLAVGVLPLITSMVFLTGKVCCFLSLMSPPWLHASTSNCYPFSFLSPSLKQLEGWSQTSTAPSPVEMSTAISIRLSASSVFLALIYLTHSHWFLSAFAIFIRVSYRNGGSQFSSNPTKKDSIESYEGASDD